MHKTGDEVTILLPHTQHTLRRTDGSVLPLDHAGQMIDLTIQHVVIPNQHQTEYLGIDSGQATYLFTDRDILHWNTGNYGNELGITMEDVKACSKAGQNNYPAVLVALEKPYLAVQVARLDKDKLRLEMKEYGAWDSDELDDHDENITRWVWCCCCEISEGNN